MTDEDLVRDLEESDEELDLDTSKKTWVQENRKVVTNSIDYTLGGLVELIDTGDLDLAPTFQRRLRWNNSRKSRLIESLLMNVPIPPIFLFEESDSRYSVIDGKQRIVAINEFMADDLELEGLTVFRDLNGKLFKDLARHEQTFLRTRLPIRAVILLDQSPPGIRLETFYRLNTGGVQLNSQEIRNIAFSGPLNDLLVKLAETREFQAALGIKDPQSSNMYQTMRDVELVLRFAAFRKTWRSFRGSVKRHMDQYMEAHREADEAFLSDLTEDFNNTLASAQSGLGSRAFRRFNPETGKWRSQVVAALYDAEMIAAQDYASEELEDYRDEIVAGMEKLFDDEEFRDATQAATNARKSLRVRIEKVSDLLSSIAD